MTLTAAVFDSLPYIDTEPTPDERAAALSLILAEMGEETSDQHPSLPPLPIDKFSPLMRNELIRIEEKIPLKAIDFSRYESNDPPDISNKDRNVWYAALRTAYNSQSYLHYREKNLESLDKFGKNSWLLGNAQLESILKDLERDLARRKTEIDHCVIARKAAQESIGGEIRVLEDSWKRSVGRALETEIAAEKLKSSISAP